MPFFGFRTHFVTRIRWNWMRLGDPAALSPAVTYLYAPFGLAGPLFIDPKRLGGNFLQWIVIAVLGQLALMLVFWIGRIFARKKSEKSGHPVFNLGVIVISVVVRGVVLALSAYQIGVIETLEFGYRLESGLVGQTAALIVVALVASSFQYHRRIAQDLAQERLDLNQASETMSTRLAEMENAIRSEVHGSIDPLIKQLDESLDQIANATDSIQVRESLRDIVDNELRPLSHRLSAPTALIAEIKEDRQELKSVPIPISSQIPLRTLISPSVVALLAALLALSQSIRALEPPNSIFFPILSGALMYILLASFRLILGSWVVKTWFGVVIATGLVLLAVVVVLNILSALNLQIPIPPELAALISVGSIGFLSAVYMVITERRSLTEEQLRAALLEEQHYVSLLRQGEFLARSHLGYLIHGTLQSTLTAAAMRLASHTQPDSELIAEIRRSISRAVAKLDSPNDSYFYLIETLTDIAELWKGTCDVHWTMDYRTVRIMVESSSAAVSVAEISRESVANAIRHGLANNVWITISEPDQSLTSDAQTRNLIVVSVRDDGQGMDPNWKPGLGSQMLDELCLEWNRVSGLPGTYLNALIATGLK